MYFAVWASSSDSSGFVEVMAPGLDRLDPAFEFVHVCIHCMPPRLRPVGTVSMIDTMILESHVLNREAPISTPFLFNAGAFRGIRRAQADIAGFRISNSYVVLDDLAFSSSATPVPDIDAGARGERSDCSCFTLAEPWEARSTSTLAAVNRCTSRTAAAAGSSAPESSARPVRVCVEKGHGADSAAVALRVPHTETGR
jgi:hypothetical protein